MVSTASNRAAFISSLKDFMNQHRFNGVDLDWEYPAAPERGGSSADATNFVSLLKEMRAALGSSFGISVVVPPVYDYLKGFNLKVLEPEVDFFSFMAYDLYVSFLNWPNTANLVV